MWHIPHSRILETTVQNEGLKFISSGLLTEIEKFTLIIDIELVCIGKGTELY